MVSIKQSDVNAMKQEATKKGCELAFNCIRILSPHLRWGTRWSRSFA